MLGAIRMICDPFWTFYNPIYGVTLFKNIVFEDFYIGFLSFIFEMKETESVLKAQ